MRAGGLDEPVIRVRSLSSRAGAVLLPQARAAWGFGQDDKGGVIGLLARGAEPNEGGGMVGVYAPTSGLVGCTVNIDAGYQ